MTRIASTAALSAPWGSAAGEAARFAATPRVLPTMFRSPMVAHALSSRVPAPARLLSLVFALRGRLAVVNPTQATRLPGGLATAMRALVRVACNESALVGNEEWENGELYLYTKEHARPRRAPDPRAAYERRIVHALVSALPPAVRDQWSAGVTWVALALYESAAPTIRLDPSGAADASTGSPSTVAVVGIDYRLVIASGSGPPRQWAALDSMAITAPAVAWPIRQRPPPERGHEKRPETSPSWFVAPLLVPDAWLTAHADAETLAQWARLTGRSGAPDQYWCPETWDRFLEPGRRVGWLTANDVWRPRRGRLASAASVDDDTPAQVGDPAALYRPPLTLTPDLERGVGVPPGYALVRCIGELSVAVVVPP